MEVEAEQEVEVLVVDDSVALLGSAVDADDDVVFVLTVKEDARRLSALALPVLGEQIS
jgi:hypothetical protein